MIAYFLVYDYDARGKCHGATAHRYNGTVTFLAESSTVLLGTGSNYVRRNKVTIFDDAHQPPRLIREDYELKKLRKFKYLKLPEQFIDMRGNIVTAKGEVLFAGPKNP